MFIVRNLRDTGLQEATKFDPRPGAQQKVLNTWVESAATVEDLQALGVHGKNKHRQLVDDFSGPNKNNTTQGSKANNHPNEWNMCGKKAGVDCTHPKIQLH